MGPDPAFLLLFFVLGPRGGTPYDRLYGGCSARNGYLFQAASMGKGHLFMERYVKGVPFSCRRYEKGVPFREKCMNFRNLVCERGDVSKFGM